jgi:hypothetical protein
MDTMDLERIFDEFLCETKCLDESEKEFAFDQLYELSFRQLYTYDLLDEKMRDRVNDFILANMDQESFEIMDSIMHIIPLLGLQTLHDEIVFRKPVIKNPEIVELVENYEAEFGNDVSDPLLGFRK